MEIFSFALYFVVVLAIGVFFFVRSKNNSEKDYFLGGRKMGPWVTAMSAQASDMSAWLLMGLPGSILAFGMGKVWIGIGLAIGTALNWIFVAKRLRCFSKAAGDSITLPQYLKNRFASKGYALQIICAIIFLVCFTVYAASAFKAGSDVFTALFPSLNPMIAMGIFAVILILYTFLGGYKAVCWTDFFQGILMLIAVLAIPIIIVLTKDLDFSALNNVYSYVDNGEVIECAFNPNPFAADWKEIASGLAWGLGYFGMPHILVRFMGIEKPSMVKKSATVAIIWVVLSLGATMVMAYFGRMLVGQQLIEAGKQSHVFIELSRNLFPPLIAGILLAAIIAASMSTADSQLLVASSSFTSDIYKPLMSKKKNVSEKETLWIGRIVVIIIAIVAFFIASDAVTVKEGEVSGAQAIMNLVENAWAGFGSAFGPVVILSLFWRRLTYKGAVAGVVTGAVVDVLWYVLFTTSGALIVDTGIYEIIPGFICGLIATVIVTLIDKQPSAEITAIYDAATSADCE